MVDTNMVQRKCISHRGECRNRGNEFARKLIYLFSLYIVGTIERRKSLMHLFSVIEIRAKDALRFSHDFSKQDEFIQ